jgi:hypothetical protein
MGKIFISYRRKEAADFTGRLFDRLCGYFGSNNVYMDVDVLVSGKDYRQQIGEIISECDVLLAIVGEQWVAMQDEAGMRRLDNPEDQLRIEIESAQEHGKAVIPILIHGVKQPVASEIPESISMIATNPGIPIDSGLPFNTDMKKLIDRLEQHYGMQNPDRRFPLELILIPLGIMLVVLGLFALPFIPRATEFISARTNTGFTREGVDYSLAGYRKQLFDTLIFCTLPLALGPPLIVAGKRWCCMSKDSRARRAHFAAGGGRSRAPKSSTCVACLAVGLAAPAFGIVASIPALILGAIGIVQTGRRHGWVRGRSLAVVGMLVALLGFGTTYYFHIPFWTFDRWLLNMEVGEQWESDGDLDAAAESYQAARLSDPEFPPAWTVALLKRAEVLEQLDRNDEAIADLTEIIDYERISQSELNPNDASSQFLMQAYQMRQSLYEKIGETDKAEEDRRMSESLFQFQGEFGNDIFDFDNVLPSNAPLAPSAEPGPAPMVDPNA